MTKSERKAIEAIERRRADGEFSHLWSDALFAREQARERAIKTVKRIEANKKSISEQKHPNSDQQIGFYDAELRQAKWDLGSFVRWTIIGTCMTFERVATDLTGTDLSTGMPRNLPKALGSRLSKDAFWLTSPWDDVHMVRDQRNAIIHRPLGKSHRFPPLDDAEFAVSAIRAGVKAVAAAVSKTAPSWIECDSVPPRLGGSRASISLESGGAKDDPDRLQICTVFGGTEAVLRVLRSDEDPWPHVERAARTSRLPLDAIRIYKGPTLAHELECEMRGT